MRIEVMSRNGDDLMAEWDAATSAAELETIGERFRALCGKGYRAFGAQTGQRIDRFGPHLEEDVVFIAPLVGG